MASPTRHPLRPMDTWTNDSSRTWDSSRTGSYNPPDSRDHRREPVAHPRRPPSPYWNRRSRSPLQRDGYREKDRQRGSVEERRPLRVDTRAASPRRTRYDEGPEPGQIAGSSLHNIINGDLALKKLYSAISEPNPGPRRQNTPPRPPWASPPEMTVYAPRQTAPTGPRQATSRNASPSRSDQSKKSPKTRMRGFEANPDSVVEALSAFSRHMHSALIATSSQALAKQSLSRLSTFVYTDTASGSIAETQRRVDEADRAVHGHMISLQSAFTDLMRRALTKPGVVDGDVSALEMDEVKERLARLEASTPGGGMIDSHFTTRDGLVPLPGPYSPPSASRVKLTNTNGMLTPMTQPLSGTVSDSTGKRTRARELLGDLMTRLEAVEQYKTNVDERCDELENEMWTQFGDRSAKRTWHRLEEARDPTGALRGTSRGLSNVDARAGGTDTEMRQEAGVVAVGLARDVPFLQQALPNEGSGGRPEDISMTENDMDVDRPEKEVVIRTTSVNDLQEEVRTLRAELGAVRASLEQRDQKIMENLMTKMQGEYAKIAKQEISRVALQFRNKKTAAASGSAANMATVPEGPMSATMFESISHSPSQTPSLPPVNLPITEAQQNREALPQRGLTTANDLETRPAMLPTLSLQQHYDAIPKRSSASASPLVNPYPAPYPTAPQTATPQTGLHLQLPTSPMAPNRPILRPSLLSPSGHPLSLPPQSPDSIERAIPPSASAVPFNPNPENSGNQPTGINPHLPNLSNITNKSAPLNYREQQVQDLLAANHMSLPPNVIQEFLHQNPQAGDMQSLAAILSRRLPAGQGQGAEIQSSVAGSDGFAQ